MRTFALLAALCATQAMAAPTTMMIGGRLAAASGNTLYVSDNDTAGSGKSACNGPCAKRWPPMTATADDQPDGDWTVVVREDGSRQWAFKGQPLYFYSADQKPGEATGDNYAGHWHVVH